MASRATTVVTSSPKRQKHGGRVKGTPNKVTQEFRETVRKLLEDNAANVAIWLEKVAEENPAKALDLLTGLAEYAAPKLARTEHVGDGGGPLSVNIVRFTDADHAAK